MTLVLRTKKKKQNKKQNKKNWGLLIRLSTYQTEKNTHVQREWWENDRWIQTSKETADTPIDVREISF